MANQITISNFHLIFYWGKAWANLQSFWSFKNGTRTFNFHSNEYSSNLLELLVSYNCLWEKKKKQIQLEASTVEFSDILNLIVQSSLRFLDFLRVFPSSLKIRKIFSGLQDCY
jgi:hypothetical protein